MICHSSKLPCNNIADILTFKMDAFQSESQKIVNKIAEYCKPEKIILFGSFAKGNQNENSDIDLLIVKKSDKKRPFRVKEIFESLRGMNRKFSLDPIVYTPQEISDRLALGDYFIKEVLKEGRIVYESK